jgi:hypothetical protein
MLSLLFIFAFVAYAISMKAQKIIAKTNVNELCSYLLELLSFQICASVCNPFSTDFFWGVA